MFVLKVDDRERNVIVNGFSCTTSVERLTVGDYAIVFDGKLLATIERKTWKDYGASIKDGRTANLAKLLDIRRTTGCDVYYIIEGKAFPHPNEDFAGIPYKNIASSIRNLQVRHGVHILRTPDEIGTVRELELLIDTYTHIEGSMEKPSRFPWVEGKSTLRAETHLGRQIDVSSLIAYFNGNINGAKLGEAFTLDPEQHDYLTYITIETPATSNFTAQQIQEFLTKRPEVTIAQEALAAMRGISGFGEKLSALAIRQSMRTYMLNGPPVGLLPPSAMRILIDMQFPLTTEARDNNIKWLAEIKGVSSQAARSLCERVGYLRGICLLTISDLAKIQVIKKAGSSPTSLGPALAKKIRDILEFSALTT